MLRPTPGDPWGVEQCIMLPMRACVRALVCVCVLSTFSNIFSSETTGPVEAKLQMEPPWDSRRTKMYSNCSNRMTKKAAMTIYGKKTLNNLLLQNRKADDLETWNVASGPREQPSLFK